MPITHNVPFRDYQPIRVTISDGEHGFKDDGGLTPWEHYKYKVTVTHYNRTLHTEYSQGTAWQPNQVDPKDVLRSLVNDYDSGRWESFEGWAEDMGYDTDSRRAERIYKALDRQRNKVDRVFGPRLEDFLEEFYQE